MPDKQTASARERIIDRIEELRKEAATYEEQGLMLLPRDSREEAGALAHGINAGNQK